MGTLTKAEESIWGMAAHLSALTALIFPLGIVLGPLAVWLLKRNDSSFVDANGKEALNFQITALVIAFALVVLSTAMGIFLVLAGIVGIGALGLAIYAGLQAKKGERYTYPFALRLIK
ncbi:MAG: DUF4870 domain-containing protein [Leucothrix sp.]